jgi:hypothetical protein
LTRFKDHSLFSHPITASTGSRSTF